MSQVAAGPHLPAKWLSAYLDGELEDERQLKVERHLKDCEECQEELAGMRSVVASLRGLEKVAPAPTLNQWVAHRVSLEKDQDSLMDRIEGHLEIFTRQSTSLFYVCMVIALGAILWLFAWGLEQEQGSRLQVLFHDPPQLRTGELLPEGPMLLAGRTFLWTGRQWVEDGVQEGGAANILWGTAEADELVASNIELADLFDLAQPVLLSVGGETLRVRHAPQDPVSTQ